MECASCLLRYNIQDRSPYIVSCGHSLCAQCFPNYQNCPFCNQLIQPNPKPNYSLLEMIGQDNKTIDKYIKVCFVGNSAVGKTSLIRQFMGENFTQDVATTIGYDFTFRDKMLGNYCVRFQLWDSAGQERYRAISPIHYKNAHVVIIVYNVAAPARENKVQQWILQAEKHAPPTALKIVIGNKMDLIQGKLCKPLENEAWDLIKQKNIECYETSCKNGIGIQIFWQVLQSYFINRKQYESQKSKQAIMANEYKNITIKQKSLLSQRKNNAKLNIKNIKKGKTKTEQCC